jgi:hypothetical protein
VWFIVESYDIQVVHEIIIYLFFALGYGFYRYTLLGAYALIKKVHSKTDPSTQKSISLSRITRKRYKPQKPKKLGIEEPHW